MPTPPPPIPRATAEAEARSTLDSINGLDLDRATRRTLAIYIGSLAQVLQQLLDAEDVHEANTSWRQP